MGIRFWPKEDSRIAIQGAFYNNNTIWPDDCMPPADAIKVHI
jgi:hypothetical protein